MDVDSTQASGNTTKNLIIERDEYLPLLISSLTEEDQTTKLLQNIRTSLTFLPTYQIAEINELLQHVMPISKKCLQKVYEDNCLLSDSVDGDFVSNILKSNLQVALGVLEATKSILSFILENGEVGLCDINSVPDNVAQMFYITFEHCKNSSDAYKRSFSMELLNVFNATQEAHLMFIKLLESCVVIKDLENELSILLKVLDTVCKISDMLSNMNIKSMSDNWKGYTAITYKFSDVLKDRINLRIPVHCLTNEINRNITSMDNLECDVKAVSQVVKVTSFLIKVALKIFDIFWSSLERITEELLNFCCTVYSISVDIFQSQDYPDEILRFIENMFKGVDPFIYRLANDEKLLKIFNPDNLSHINYPFGMVTFLNSVLRFLISSEDSTFSARIDIILRTMFVCLNLCYAEFFLISQNLFDELILNVAAVTLMFPDFYGDIEHILYISILGDNVWTKMLALEVWCLVLCNLNSQISFETLATILTACDNLDLGIFTNRLEKTYLKCLLQRIYTTLPLRMKNDLAQDLTSKKNMAHWKIIGFQNSPTELKYINYICTTVQQKVESMERGNYCQDDLLFVAEHLELLSTVNFKEMRIDSNRLLDTVYSLWEYKTSTDIALNNIFQYLLTKLYKITCTLILEFSSQQLCTILNQLTGLIHETQSNKLITCYILAAIFDRSTNFGEGERKICQLTFNLLYPSLWTTRNNIIRQHTLDVINILAIHPRPSIIPRLLEQSKEIYQEIINYLERRKMRKEIDKNYLNQLGNVKFRHQCILWKIDNIKRPIKKIKTDIIAETKAVMDHQVVEKWEVLQTIVSSKESQSNHIDEEKTDNITDVLVNIKGEVKSLMNVLKTEKPSRKNVSDIKLIANQLLSLL